MFDLVAKAHCLAHCSAHLAPHQQLSGSGMLCWCILFRLKLAGSHAVLPWEAAAAAGSRDAGVPPPAERERHGHELFVWSGA